MRSSDDDMRSYEDTVAKKVNSNNYTSRTKYLIYVDTAAFKVNLFTGSKNKWKLDKSYLCTIGKNSTPTPKGTFTVGVKGLYFGVNKGYKCWYYTSFKGNYLFHSIIYNLDGSVKDGRLGMKLSDGCIRLAKANAKYIWDNVPAETKVIII
ncbi:MAG: L,D-transpeptidase [Clostridium sp.]|nr:L,D-transpeptidase [Clostridium sp.]